MSKRKSAKEVLAGYSSQQLVEMLIEELNAVGIEYAVDFAGCASEFIPLSAGDTTQKEVKPEMTCSFSIELFATNREYPYTAPARQKVQMKKSFSEKIDDLQSKVTFSINSIVAA